jgi:hypothetical protein
MRVHRQNPAVEGCSGKKEGVGMSAIAIPDMNPNDGAFHRRVVSCSTNQLFPDVYFFWLAFHGCCCAVAASVGCCCSNDNTLPFIPSEP